MAKKTTVRVQMSEIELVGLDQLCNDLEGVNSRSDAIRHAVSRTLMRSTIDKADEARRQERTRFPFLRTS